MEPEQTLFDMIQYRRPGWSKTERRFIGAFLMPLGVTPDNYGNYSLRIGDAPILWSAHTDTVHTAGGRQRLSRVGDTLTAMDTASNCLGADNTAGVWLLCEMIRAEIPGLYVFHRGEETGGGGSSFIAQRTPEMVAGIKAAIAFDRRNTKSIITHQFPGRTCSDAFADSLGAALALGHEKDDGGTFTDTASYVDLIGECTNVSVGFNNEHRANESLDLAYLMRLRTAMLGADLSALAYTRQPGEVEPVDVWAGNDDWRRDPDGTWHIDRKPLGANGTAILTALANDSTTTAGRRQWRRGWTDLDDGDKFKCVADVLRAYPNEVADYLETSGYDVAEMLDIVGDRS